MTELTSMRGAEESAIDGIQATVSERARTVELGLFSGEGWKGALTLGRARALELHRELEEAIRWFWPRALPGPDVEQRLGALHDALAAAMTCVEHLCARLTEPEEKDEREQAEGLLEDIREALTLGAEFDALKEIRDITARHAPGAAARESAHKDIRYVALRGLRLAGRRGSALQTAIDR
jgi:hypothetical protein